MDVLSLEPKALVRHNGARTNIQKIYHFALHETPLASITERVTQALNGQVKKEVTVLSSLICVQEEFGYLPPESVPTISGFTGASVNEVYGVATFYTHFRFVPPGQHIIEVCWGPSCHVLGADKVLSAVKNEIGLEDEGTTPDGRFTWKRTSCAAACANGPVILVDEKIYGRVTSQSAVDIIRQSNKTES